MLQSTAAIEDQQAIIDTVEYRLQAPLLGQQRFHVAVAKLLQCPRHQTEAPAQGSQFRDRGNRQGDAEIPLADQIGGVGQRLDRSPEALGDAMGRHQTQHQYRHAD